MNVFLMGIEIFFLDYNGIYNFVERKGDFYF